MSATPKLFHLLGDDAATAREVEIPSSIDFEGLRQLIASHFSIVEPKGVGFSFDNGEMTTVAEVRGAAGGPVAVTIDGRAVREVPGPKGLPYLGNYFEIYPDHLGNHQRLFEQYGPLFQTTNLGQTMYHTNDPRLANIVFAESDFFSKHIIPGHPLHAIKQQEAGVFLADTDRPEWKLLHKFLPPALGPKAVRHYAPTMQGTVEDAFKVFDALEERGEAWNVYSYMLKMGAQAVGKLVLGMDFRHFETPDTPLAEMVINIAVALELNKKLASMPALYRHLPFGDPKRFRDIIARTETLIYESIDRASKGAEDLELQEAALTAENMVDYLIRATDSKGNKVPRDKIASPLAVATGAGFTTTSSLLSWLIYGLVAYPGMQERLLQELVDAGWADDTLATADLTGRLPFLDCYIKETQRRHNPSYQPARTAMADMILPGGYRLARGSIVIPALHHIHNNAQLWDNPARFDPDRWADPDANRARQPGSYMPFAAGPRMCIGFNFALQEVKIFLTKLVWRYRFTQAVDEGPGAAAGDGRVEYDPMFQLIRPNNLYVHAERRVKWPPRSDAA